MPAPAHVQAATLDKFLASWKDSNPGNTMALWSDDFTQRILPLSLGMPVNSRVEAETFYPNLVKRKWTNEYAIFITFSEDGHRVSKLEEMLDSAFFRDFFPKLRKHISGHGDSQT
ncbi:hypothetical protein INS49_012291 [Diaporthe citri]|uniref:uncharacterized protein n=1 Tax=Diaporthe citri TaxID=83186 RepID=UPI001C7EF2F5|nr:uncharacterized protein INS49_012291 [Diaporthe citri]KAG6358772.1 hypothetical protein INS49_012291 [Diaporthe citri]